MAVHFILDGYNVIQQDPDLSRGSLREGRLRLIRSIEIQRPQGSARNRVTVVFDGRREVSSPPVDSLVRVIFTSGESADDRIKQLVARAPHKRNQIVVTNDRDIRHHVRALGAGIMGVKEFLARMQPERTPRRSSAAGSGARSGKRIPQGVARKINQEMRDIWLRRPS